MKDHRNQKHRKVICYVALIGFAPILAVDKLFLLYDIFKVANLTYHAIFVVLHLRGGNIIGGPSCTSKKLKPKLPLHI